MDESEFWAVETPYTDPEEFRERRERKDIFVHRLRGEPEATQVLEIALVESPDKASAKAFSTHEHLRVLARLVEAQLVTLLPKLELRRTKWGLERVRRQDDLVDAAFKRLGRPRPPTLAGIHKFHRTMFAIRCVFIPGRGKLLISTVEFRRHQEIEPTACELSERGLDLRGLEVFERTDGDRRLWLGVVKDTDGGSLVLEGDDGERRVDGKQHWIGPSTNTFRVLFEQTLGQEGYKRFAEAEWAQRAEEVCGKGYVTRLEQVADHLRRAGSLKVAPELHVKFGDIVALPTKARTPAATQLAPIEYCFSWDRSNIEKIPAAGLDKFGPFDGSTFDTKEPRLLVVCPAECQADVEQFVQHLRDGTTPDSRNPFRGLVATYRLTRLAIRFAPVVLRGINQGVGGLYVDVLSNELGTQKAPDIALVFVRDEDAFVERDNPYRASKAFLLRQGIPSQEVRLSKARSHPSDLPYILRDIAVAVYAKLGGCPWTVRTTMPIAHEVVVGMAHAEFGSRHSVRRRYMGITTIFNSDGAYLLAAGSPRCKYEDYPATLAESVCDVLRRLARDQNWVAGDMVRLIFHAPKPLTGRETETLASQVVGTLDKDIQFEAAFLTIETNHPFKVLAPHESGRQSFVELMEGGHGRAMVGVCAPPRGMVIDLGHSKRLLCVNGPLLMKREGESIPHPLQIELHRSSTYTDLGALTRQVFHFTGLSWRSMLPVTVPVTILYPHLIADLLGRLADLPDWSDDLLDTRLRRSRWFL